MIIVSTKSVFRGVLCLYATVATVTSVAQSAECEKQYWSVAEAINEFNQKSWRIIGHNKIVDADKDSWIKDTKYEESITKVIGEALGKCLSDTGEFANKNSGDTVTFAVTPEQTKYTPGNWNAVVLWNYLNQLKWNFTRNKELTSDKVFTRVYNLVFNYYNYEYNNIIGLENAIGDAISDIKKYAKELNLYDYMKACVDTVQQLKDKDVKWIYDEVRTRSQAGGTIKISPIMEIGSTDYTDNNLFSHILGFADIKSPLKMVVGGSTYMLSRLQFDWGKNNDGVDKSALNRKVKEATDPTYGSLLPMWLYNDVYTQALKILED